MILTAASPPWTKGMVLNLLLCPFLFRYCFRPGRKAVLRGAGCRNAFPGMLAAALMVVGKEVRRNLDECEEEPRGC